MGAYHSVTMAAPPAGPLVLVECALRRLYIEGAMTAESSLLDLTACPRCDKAPLARKNDHFICAACKTRFPMLSEIPWLFAEPEASLGEWRNRLHFALQQFANDAQRLRAELERDKLHALTRKRLDSQLAAIEEHRKKLRQYLAPLDIQSMQASSESHLALRTRLPVDQGIHTYYANLHRDWSWGDEENSASLKQIRKIAAGDDQLGDTLVIGAGASRLAFDIHMQMQTKLTVAMDFNPLLLLIAQRLVSGESVQFHEFPLAPLTLDDYAVLRTLAAPGAVREGFEFVFGDALRPPFSVGSFDTVITPWIIDIVNEDLPVQIARINQLLKPGGRWFNFGSLAFDHPERSRRYSAEETLAIVAEGGFGPPATSQDEIPYMCSPSSRHARREKVFAFAVTKEESSEKPSRHKALPDWIVTGKEPVPLTQSFRKQAVSTQIHAFIMSLIDGKRTIDDVAAVLEQQQLMTRAEAKPAIRNFLTRMYDDSQRNSGY